MEINQLVALRIKEIRTNQGITCQAMADDLGITIGSYSVIENRKRKSSDHLRGHNPWHRVVG